MTITNTVITLADQLKRFKGNKQFDFDLLKLYLKNNPVLMDIPFTESNDGTIYSATVAIGRHDPEWRAYGEGFPAGKINYKQMRFTSGRLVSGVKLEGDAWEEANEQGKSAMLETELDAAAEGMKQKIAHTLFYGGNDDPRAFNGLNSLFPECGAHLPGVDSDERAHYCINGAKAASPSTDALRSIWCIAWERSKFTAFYPKGHGTAGLERGTLEKYTKEGENGDTFKFYKQDLVWKMGFAPVDFRQAGRIANIEADKMISADGHTVEGQPNYIQLINKLVSRTAPSKIGKKVLYTSPIVWENLMTIFGNATQGNAIKFEDLEQYKRVPTLYGTPVVLCDCLDVAEELVPVKS